MATESNREDVVRSLAQVSAVIKERQKSRRSEGEIKEQDDKLAAEVARLTKLVDRGEDRRGELNQPDAAMIRSEFDEEGRRTSPTGLNELIENEALTEEIKELQVESDKIYLMSQALRCNPKDLKYFHKVKNRLPILRKSLDTTAGADWIPTAFSSDLHRTVRLNLRVAALHNTIEMPTNPYKLPIEGLDPIAYRVSQQGDSDADLDTTKRVSHSFSAGDSPGLTNLTLTVDKLGARVTFAAELSEESIIPILGYLRDKVALCMAQAIEDVTINGDTAVNTVSAMDSDMVSPTAGALHRRKSWSGYRKLTQSACKIANTETDKKLINIQDVRTLRQEMGLFGLIPGESVVVTGPVGYIKLLSIKDTLSGRSPVMTIEQYGPQATVVTGEIARVDGMPIVLSEFVREDLSTTGAYDGVTTNRTMILMVNRAQFIYGNFRNMTLKQREIIETDQTTMVAMMRMTFAGWVSSGKTVGFVYNIQK